MGIEFTKQIWIHKGSRALVLIVVILQFAYLAGQAAAKAPAGKKVEIRNKSDRPIRLFFVKSDYVSCFCVLQVNAGGQALIENVKPGHWQVNVIELVDDFPIATHPVRLVESERNVQLTVNGQWGAAAPAGYSIEVD